MIQVLKNNIKRYLKKSMRGREMLRLVQVFLKPITEIWNKFRRLLGKVEMLYLEVTHSCDLRCVGCYTKAGKEKNDVLTLEEKKSVVRQAKKMGARFVSLSGSGEPLLYDDIFILIDYIKQLQMGVIIYTNGTLLSKEVADFLVSRSVQVYFKLYSLNPTIFNRMVGVKDAYQWVDYSYNYNGEFKTIKIPSGLKYLFDVHDTTGHHDLVKIEALITRINFSALLEVARFCKEVNLPLFLETPVFNGRAVNNYKNIMLSSDEYQSLYYGLEKILGKKYLQTLRHYSCPVESNPVVWTNGELGFCSSRKACIGNVRNTPLKILFLKAKKLKRQEDCLISKQKVKSKYFCTCNSRQYYEAKHNIPTNY